MIYVNPFIRSSDRAGYVIATFICDTEAELPATNYLTGYTLEMGSTAHVIENSGDYEMQSDGTWIKRIPAELANTYTRSEIDNMVSDIDTAINDEESARENADTLQVNSLVHLIDTGAKNILQMTGTNVTGYGISCTFDNVNGIITLDGINPDKKCTGSFNVQVADPNNLDLVEGVTYHFLCDGTSDTTYGIYIYKSGATPNSQFDSYTNNELPWNDAWNTSNGFRLFIRQGTIVDNVQLKPMITLADFWKISEKFVPYCPTVAELYAMIRSYHP